MDDLTAGYSPVIEEICNFAWDTLDAEQMTLVAWAYYYFSVQFRENLLIAVAMYPDDLQLARLLREECDTGNLSPWQNVAAVGELMNHDEFMRRILTLSAVAPKGHARAEAAGTEYLAKVRAVDDLTKAMSIVSYEDGGLEAVFTAFMRAREWSTPLLQGFMHFLRMHIQFDSNPDGGHGALCSHLRLDDRIRPLWVAFRDLLIETVPGLML
jgi:hypothetical protein